MRIMRVWNGAIVGAALSLTGCASFFPPLTTTTPAGGSTASAGDSIYVTNSSLNTLSGFAVGPSALTPVTSSPYTLETQMAVRSVTVSRSNGYVYAGGLGSIDCFSIGTAGALTEVTANRIVVGTTTAVFAALETSPDGKWLFAFDAVNLSVYVFSLNTATGAPALATSTNAFMPANGGVVSQPLMRISPAGTALLVAGNSAGTNAYTFNTANGVLTYEGNLGAAGYSDNAVTFDVAGSYAYIARAVTNTGTNGVSSFSVNSAGGLTSLPGLAASGAAPSSLVFDLTGTYLYTGNAGDMTIDGYTSASGVLTALTSNPVMSGGKVLALARDNSGKYIASVASTGGSDITLYGLDVLTAGRLVAVATGASGSAGATAIAATHTTAGL